MNVKRYWMAVAAVFVSVGIVATIIADVLFVDQFASLTVLFRPEAEINMALFLLGHFLETAVIVFIFVRGYEGLGMIEGVRFGLAIGALLA